MSSLNPNSVFLVWKQMAKTLFVVKGIMYESEPFLNRRIWINSGSDLWHGMSPGMWSTAGTFINKFHTLKPSESEKLIFILANHDFFFLCHWVHAWRSGRLGKLSLWVRVCMFLHQKSVFWSYFQDPIEFKRNYFEEITEFWLAVNLISLYVIFWYLQQCKV